MIKKLDHLDIEMEEVKKASLHALKILNINFFQALVVDLDKRKFVRKVSHNFVGLPIKNYSYSLRMSLLYCLAKYLSFSSTCWYVLIRKY